MTCLLITTSLFTIYNNTSSLSSDFNAKQEVNAFGAAQLPTDTSMVSLKLKPPNRNLEKLQVKTKQTVDAYQKVAVACELVKLNTSM